ncbi:ComF family protein [Candidatus Saccharibacteria bacterium]|nr:ComF family protein [Candidatus Saccharibacteria bacterium]
MKARQVGNMSGGLTAEYLGFRDEILGELIEEAKYESVRGLLPEIAEVVYAGYFEKYVTENDVGSLILVPMPTSRQHVRERAIDHMNRIVLEIERLSDNKIQHTRLLERAKDTVQMGANVVLRKKQAKEAVKINPQFVSDDGKINLEYRSAKVVLIDDVWTTGSSLIEAGKILKEAGVKNLKLVAITKSRARRSPTLRHGEIY